MHKTLLASLQSHSIALGWSALGFGMISFGLGAAWAHCAAAKACPMASGGPFFALGGAAVLLGAHLLGLSGRLRGRAVSRAAASPVHIFTSPEALPADDWQRVVGTDVPMSLAYFRGLTAAR